MPSCLLSSTARAGITRANRQWRLHYPLMVKVTCWIRAVITNVHSRWAAVEPSLRGEGRKAPRSKILQLLNEFFKLKIP